MSLMTWKTIYSGSSEALVGHHQHYHIAPDGTGEASSSGPFGDSRFVWLYHGPPSPYSDEGGKDVENIESYLARLRGIRDEH